MDEKLWGRERGTGGDRGKIWDGNVGLFFFLVELGVVLVRGFSFCFPVFMFFFSLILF
jgi:hypothetical protein